MRRDLWTQSLCPQPADRRAASAAVWGQLRAPHLPKHHRPCDATVSLLGDGPTHEGLLPSKHWDLRQVHFRQVYRALPDPWPRTTSGQRARSFGVRSSVVLRTTPFCWLPLGKGVSYERASHAVTRTTRCRHRRAQPARKLLTVSALRPFCEVALSKAKIPWQLPNSPQEV